MFRKEISAFQSNSTKGENGVEVEREIEQRFAGLKIVGVPLKTEGFYIFLA